MVPDDCRRYIFYQFRDLSGFLSHYDGSMPGLQYPGCSQNQGCKV